MEAEGVILTLPNELLLHILHYLKGADVYSFSLTCKRFSLVCFKLRTLDFSQLWATPISPESIKSFLSTSIQPSSLTSCNFSNCYWLPAILLVQFIKRCANLCKLKVGETRINCFHISQILKKCEKLTHLSMSLSHNDLWLSQKDRFQKEIKSTEDLLPYTWFKECHEELRKLLEIELVSFSAIHDLTVLISFCDNLERLTVVFPTWTEKDREKQDTYDRVRLIAEMRNHSMIQGHSSLKSLVFVNAEEEQSIAMREHPRRQEYLIFKSDLSQLTTHWNDSSPCPVTKTNFTALAFKGFSSPAGIYEAWFRVRNALPDESGANSSLNKWYIETNPLEKVNLKSVHSVREGRPTFMKQGIGASDAKVINCFYYDDGFSEFCQNHQKLVSLRLRKSTNDDGSWDLTDDPANKAGPQWTEINWGNLRQLESLSIESSLLYQEKQCAVVAPGKRRKLGHIFSPPKCQYVKQEAFLKSVFRSCLHIKELEIYTLAADSPTDSKCWIDSEDLSVLSECSNLVSLTLGQFFVTDGQFLEEILRKCSKLETLKLKNVGPQLLCCYTKSLCIGLKSCKNLKTLSVFQRNMVPMTVLFDSLESCPSLQRLALVAPSDTSPFKLNGDGLTRMMVEFCSKLKNLVCLFLVLNIPKAHCSKATKELCKRFEPDRASFCVDLQSSEKPQRHTESTVLPLVHRQALIDFSSRVGTLPWNVNCDFV